jgi:5,10-methylenetetrahydromethanopterin reductase
VRNSYGLGVHTGAKVSEIMKSVRGAEKMGFDLVSISEDPYHRDCLPIIALALSATKTIKVATGIINLYTKSPVYAAMAAGTLDEIGGGRLILGLGRGVKSLIEDELHIPYGSPLRYTREYLVCLRKLLEGKRVTYDGKQVKLTDAQLHFEPIRKHIPTLIAAMGEKTVALAAKYADGVMLNSCTSVKHARLARRVLDANWVRKTKPILTNSLWTSVDEDLDRAYDSVRTLVGFLLSIPTFGESFLVNSGLGSESLPELRRAFRWDAEKGDPMRHLANAGGSSLKGMVSDEILEALTVCGPVEKCRRRFSQYFEAGVTTAIISPMTRKTSDSLELLIS